MLWLVKFLQLYKCTYSITTLRLGWSRCWEWRRGSEAPSHTRDDIVVADVGAECSWACAREMSYEKMMGDESEELYTYLSNMKITMALEEYSLWE